MTNHAVLSLLFGCLCVVPRWCVASNGPLPVYRNTSLGRVLGYVDPQLQAELYLGLPFAKPPLGARRFQYPEPPEPWNGTYNATYFRHWCVQFWYSDVHLDQRPQSEDCLYLNIIIPTNATARKPYPVLFWIHGGSYQVGGARLFPIDGTVRNLVSRGIVFVSTNYRLGPIGFLSSVRHGLAGNYGLEDQLIALQWVHQHVAQFDGDPERVTACGESSGAASVGLLATSPRAKGLFRLAVMRSGSALSPWAVQTTNTGLNSGRLLELTNCSHDGLACLQQVSVDELKSAWKTLAADDLMLIYSNLEHKPLNYNHPFLAHTYFTPVVDKHRLEKSMVPMAPKKLVERNARLPVLIGTTSGECISYVSWLASLAESNKLDMKNIEYVAPSFLFTNAEQVKQAVYNFYFTNRPISTDSQTYRQTLVRIVTDQNIHVPAIMEMAFYRNKRLPVYAYRFDYVNEHLQGKHFSFGIKNQSAAHGFDLVYLFQSMSVLDPRDIEVSWTDSDRNVTGYLASTLSNFVKSGSPSGEQSVADHWPLFDMHFGRQMYVGRTHLVEHASFEPFYFWTRTVEAIQALTLHAGYVFRIPDDHQSLRERCAQCCDALFYKVGFFVVLTISLALVFLLGLCCVVQVLLRNRKAIANRRHQQEPIHSCPF